MKLYLCPMSSPVLACLPVSRRILLPLFILLSFFSAQAQELQFTNGQLISGTDGSDGAVYLFSSVDGNNKVDAMVTISGRSSSLVHLLNIDVTGMGFNKAFQPQITYDNNTTPAGTTDWWMEFQVSFVKHGYTSSVPVDSFRCTALDIDGNGDKINEWVSFYGCKSYSLESNSLVQALDIMGLLNGVSSLLGKQFSGPVTNYANIDTSATQIMATTLYQMTNSFRIRAGGHSTGSNGAADRLYSFWFRSFNFQVPVEFTLPLVLLNFDATLNGNKVDLNWATGMEKELSHFVIERSTDGLNYSDAAIVFANGNSNSRSQYSFRESVNSSAKGVLYYRLRMVDADGHYQYSPVRLIRLGSQDAMPSLLIYPNPVQNELRITIPQGWQGQPVRYEIYNMNGQMLKNTFNAQAGQTETIQVQDLLPGVYMVKVSTGAARAIQRMVKAQ